MDKSNFYTRVASDNLQLTRSNTRRSRSSNNVFPGSALANQNEEEAYSVSGGMGGVRGGVEEFSRRSSMSKSYDTRMSPSFAAAMLSLPWPPSDLVRQPHEYPASSKSNVDQDDDDTLPMTVINTPYPKLKAILSTSKSIAVKKLQEKISSKFASLNPEEENKPPEYQPFTIPKFDEVATEWPGFIHQPVPDWQEKYLIAKPYPKEAPSAEKSKSLVKMNKSISKVNNNTIAGPFSDSEDDLQKETLRKPKSKRSKLKTTPSTQGDSGKPRRRLVVERVGSCIR